jgi:hypothetical protein
MIHLMQKFIALYILFFTTLYGQAFNVGQEIQLAKTYIKTFSDTFNSDIKSNHSACTLIAPKLSVFLSKESGAKINRISLYIRNPINIPDKWEREQLERLTTKNRRGNPLVNDEYFEMTQEGRQQYFRYIKPIMMKKNCLKCHGPLRDADESLFNTIRKDYPHENAWGHKTGDLRGVYSYKKPI